MKRNVVTTIICCSIIFCLIQKQLDNIKNKINILNKNSKQENKIKAMNDTTIPYKKHAGKFTATFYCDCPICVGHKKVVRTKTGNIPHPYKTIAVDPRIIPLHSIVYIKDMGFFVAEDIGGYIKGKRIDIFVNNHDEALKMGRKQVDIYILE